MHGKQIGLLEELRGLIPDRAVDILKQVLGQIGASLEHHGPIAVKGSKNRPHAEDRVIADLDVADNAVARFKGKAQGVCRWAKVVGDWQQGPNVKSGLIEFWVPVRIVDHDGLHETGPPLQIRLIVTGGNMPDVLPDDILPFFYDANGMPVSFPSVAQYTYGTDGDGGTATDIPHTDDGLVLLA